MICCLHFQSLTLTGHYWRLALAVWTLLHYLAFSMGRGHWHRKEVGERRYASHFRSQFGTSLALPKTPASFKKRNPQLRKVYGLSLFTIALGPDSTIYSMWGFCTFYLLIMFTCWLPFFHWTGRNMVGRQSLARIQHNGVEVGCEPTSLKT